MDAAKTPPGTARAGNLFFSRIQGKKLAGVVPEKSESAGTEITSSY